MHISEMRILNAKLKDNDHAKAFILFLEERDALHVTELSEAAKLATIQLGRLGLVSIVKATVKGAPHAWVGLTRAGKEIAIWFKSEWSDELQKWAEIEGETPSITVEEERAVEAKEIEYFRKHIAEEDNA